MKIALIGRIAERENLYDGQTVKTRYLYEMLKTIGDVYLVDTYEYRKHKLAVFFRSILALKKCEIIVISISINGRKFFFPFFYYMNIFFKRKIFHSSIGGRLANNIKENPSWIKYINSFKVNWVESHELVENLEALGIANALYLPNYKRLRKAELQNCYSYFEPYSFCMFCRVQEQKGVSDAIDAIKGINKKYNCKKVKLDIYGPIDEDYIDEFKKNINDSSDYVEYKGVVDASQSVDTLKNYYMLLFPTKYFNEGIPGTIIDALAAGIPVIARKWHYCSEMLIHKNNGLIYDFDNENGLIEMIDYSINHVQEIINMKSNCIEKSEEYLFENVLNSVKTELLK